MWEQALLACIYVVTVCVAVKAFLWQRSVASEALAQVEAKDAEIAKLKDGHRRELQVKAEEDASVRRELRADIERLGRECYKLRTVAEVKRELDFCHRCDQPKGKQPAPENGQRGRGNARVHAIVNGE